MMPPRCDMSDELRFEEITEEAGFGGARCTSSRSNAETKSPMAGYGWAVEAPNADAEIVRTSRWHHAVGANNVSIAWALGTSTWRSTSTLNRNLIGRGSNQI
jgi:hypothetical protein